MRRSTNQPGQAGRRPNLPVKLTIPYVSSSALSSQSAVQREANRAFRAGPVERSVRGELFMLAPAVCLGARTTLDEVTQDV